MNSIDRQSHDSGSSTRDLTGDWLRAWLIPAIVMLVMVVLYMLSQLKSAGASMSDVVNARALPQFTQTLSVSKVIAPAGFISETAQITLRQQVEISTTLLVIGERAGIVTAAVGLENDRGSRIIAAGNAAVKVLTLAQACDELAPGFEMATVLQELARALSTYDIDEVQNGNSRLAELRQQLTNAIHAAQPGDLAFNNLKFD